MKPTDEQARCLDLFPRGDALRINAYAGTGKTSTLTLLGKSTRRRGLYLAFNKSIADEAKGKFAGSSVTCMTTHALAFRQFINAYGVDKMTRGLTGRFLAGAMGYQGAKLPGELVITANQVGALVLETLRNWMRSDAPAPITSQFVPFAGMVKRLTNEAMAEGVDSETRQQFLSARELLKSLAATRANKAWQDMCDPKGKLPLGHDGYLKLWALDNPQLNCDYLLFDEAQDTNPAVLGVVCRQTDCQVISVGDRHQQIYEWRGAVNAMDLLPVANEARLTTSFRFGPEIAATASSVLHLLGETVPLRGNPNAETNAAGPICYLSRTNAGLLESLAYQLEQGRRPYIVGGTQELITYARAIQSLQNGAPVDYPLEFAGFKTWDEAQQESEFDADLKRWVRLADTFGASDLLSMLGKVPSKEESADVVLSTGHKSKGREWSRVNLDADFLRGVSATSTDSGADAASCTNEELRLLYVAATRGKVRVDWHPELSAKFARVERAKARATAQAAE